MATIKIKDGNGDFQYIAATGSGTLTDPYITIPSDLNLAIPMGMVDGYSSVNKFGANVDITANTQEDIWDGGGTYPFPSTAVITSISQTADQAAMRGQNIEVQGLDSNWDLVVQTATLDASNTTTVVTLTTPLIRVFRAKVMANIVSTSPVRIHNAAETVDYAIITPENNQTLMAIYTVPNGYTAYITSYNASNINTATKTAKSTEIKLWTADRDNGYEFQLKHADGIPQEGAGIVKEFKPFLKVNQKNDIKITGTPIDQDGHVHAGFDLILIKN